MAGDLAALHEDLLVERNTDRLAGACRNRRGLDVPGLDRTNPGHLVGRREHQPVADLEHPGFDTPGNDPPLIELVDILDQKAERLIERQRYAVKAVECLEHAGTGVPGHRVRGAGHVAAVTRRDRHHEGRLDAELPEVISDVAGHFGKARLAVVHKIHLVDGDGDLANTEQV